MDTVDKIVLFDKRVLSWEEEKFMITSYYL